MQFIDTTAVLIASTIIEVAASLPDMKNWTRYSTVFEESDTWVVLESLQPGRRRIPCAERHAGLAESAKVRDKCSSVFVPAFGWYLPISP